MGILITLLPTDVSIMDTLLALLPTDVSVMYTLLTLLLADVDQIGNYQGKCSSGNGCTEHGSSGL